MRSSNQIGSVKPALRRRGERAFGGRRRQQGQAMIEGALSLTVLLMILFGIMDFGRAVFSYNLISYAARAASRYAMVHGESSSSPVSSTDVQTFVQNQSPVLDKTAMTVTTTWSPNNSAGSAVKVKVQYTFQPLVPYVPSSAITLSSTSQMTISQ